MGLNITQKLISSQLVEGDLAAGEIVRIHVSQTLAHDLSGPAVLTGFERLGLRRVATEVSAFYIDHAVQPTSREDVERQRYLSAAAGHFGCYFSRPGNGTSHHVHMERMATPGRVLLGAASHAQTLGAVSMLALSADADEVAATMAGEPHRFVVPEVLRVVLHGKPKAFVSPKDIGLELLRRRGVGGVAGRVLELDGPGVRALGVYERATIAALGPTLGALTTVFPSDEKTKIFLQRQRRSKSWRRIEADNDAEYEDTEVVDLGALEPLALCSTEPCDVRPVREVHGTPIREVQVGSCSNASSRDMLAIAGLMRGKKVHGACTFTISPSSRQALEVLARVAPSDSGGGLADLISAGVRLLESSCGPCERARCYPTGEGVARTFLSRDGFGPDEKIFVVSPETAAACAIHGKITDPRKLRRPPRIKLPRQMPVDDSMIVKPKGASPRAAAAPHSPLARPSRPDLERDLRATVRHVDGDGERPCRHGDAARARSDGAGTCLVAGSRTALDRILPDLIDDRACAPPSVVVAEGFAPTCAMSLANAGVLPLTLVDADDAKRLRTGATIVLKGVGDRLRSRRPIAVAIKGERKRFEVTCDLDDRTMEVLISGGLLSVLEGTFPRE